MLNIIISNCLKTLSKCRLKHYVAILKCLIQILGVHVSWSLHRFATLKLEAMDQKLHNTQVTCVMKMKQKSDVIALQFSATMTSSAARYSAIKHVRARTSRHALVYTQNKPLGRLLCKRRPMKWAQGLCHRKSSLTLFQPQLGLGAS